MSLHFDNHKLHLPTILRMSAGVGVAEGVGQRWNMVSSLGCRLQNWGSEYDTDVI
jgi:hypothetical protein